MSKRDYYEILGLSKGADKKAVKTAYRKLAKQYHPDRNKEAGAEEKFREVQEAYEVLSDENKKTAYDQYGHAATQGFGGAGDFGGYSGNFSDMFGGGADLGDLLGGFFGGGFGQQGSRRANDSGSDIQTSIKLSFMEAVFGVEKNIEYARYAKCTHCAGTGAHDGKKKTCTTCSGRGQVTKVQRTILGAMQMVTTCDTCDGTGEISEKDCTYCNGNGVEKVREKFSVKFPAGIPDGVNLRFTERGNAGTRGGAYGDLYISIEVAEHAVLERRGNDTYMDLKVDAVTAVLGGEKKIPTVHGEVFLKIPSGTQPEKVLRLKEKGGPKFKQSGNGDQYVRILIDIPTKLNSKQKEAWEKLSELY